LQPDAADGLVVVRASEAGRGGRNAGKPASGGAGSGGQAKPLRMYGQRKPKADPVTEAATISQDVLSLIAGRAKKRKASLPGE
jgi:hypothetical protein